MNHLTLLSVAVSTYKLSTFALRVCAWAVSSNMALAMPSAGVGGPVGRDMQTRNTGKTVEGKRKWWISGEKGPGYLGRPLQICACVTQCFVLMRNLYLLTIICNNEQFWLQVSCITWETGSKYFLQFSISGCTCSLGINNITVNISCRILRGKCIAWMSHAHNHPKEDWGPLYKMFPHLWHNWHF